MVGLEIDRFVVHGLSFMLSLGFRCVVSGFGDMLLVFGDIPFGFTDKFILNDIKLSFADRTPFFADIIHVFADKRLFFADRSCIFADIIKFFADSPFMFAGRTKFYNA
jgi:hypothetical protein